MSFLYSSSLSPSVGSKKYVIQLTIGSLLVLIPLSLHYYFSLTMGQPYEYSHIFKYIQGIGLICFAIGFPMFLTGFLSLCILYGKRLFLWFFFLAAIFISIGLIGLMIWSLLKGEMSLLEKIKSSGSLLTVIAFSILLAVASYKYIKTSTVKSEDILNTQINEEIKG